MFRAENKVYKQAFLSNFMRISLNDFVTGTVPRLDSYCPPGGLQEIEHRLNPQLYIRGEQVDQNPSLRGYALVWLIQQEGFPQEGTVPTAQAREELEKLQALGILRQEGAAYRVVTNGFEVEVDDRAIETLAAEAEAARVAESRSFIAPIRALFETRTGTN